MATLADELLNDFEDSGSEKGEEQDGFLDDENEQANERALKIERSNSGIGMELDDDEEEVEDADEELAAQSGEAAHVAEDPNDTKAKVERMKLGGVEDVRTVASLMKTLQPVLEVCTSLFLPFSCAR